MFKMRDESPISCVIIWCFVRNPMKAASATVSLVAYL